MFLSRADREIAVFRHVAPPSRLRLEFPRETASSEVRGEGREPFADKAGELTLEITLDERPNTAAASTIPEQQGEMPQSGDFDELYEYFRRYFGG